MDGISRETFERLDTDSKLNVLFDFALNANKTAIVAHETVEKLTEAVRRRRKLDTTIAAAMGLLGGMIAHLGQLTLFGHK